MPPHVDAELAKSENWWYKPEYICNDLSINSAIAKPDHDEVLKVIPGKTYKCGGYCYTGGGRRITRIEVSLNSGALWGLAKINITEKPSRSGKYWCWIFWEYECTHDELANASEIVLRGWDEGHQTQVCAEHYFKPTALVPIISTRIHRRNCYFSPSSLSDISERVF